MSRESDHDRPETYAAYHSAAQVPLAGDAGAPAVVGLKSTGLVVHFADATVLHYDLQGRLLRVAQPNVQWRRGLSGRTLRLRRRTREEGGSLQRDHVDPAEADALLDQAHGRMQEVRVAFRAEHMVRDTGEPRRAASALPAVLARAAAFDRQAAACDLQQFRALYHDIPILPPDQYNALVLLASDGCRYNKCTFCNFYRDVPYRPRTWDQFRQHVDAAVAYYGPALAARRHIFLGQANALLGPRTWREEVLRYLSERFELPPPDAALHPAVWWQGSASRFAGITSFLDAFVGARLDADEFAALRQLNLRQIFIGMETGSAALLEWLRKPASPEQMLSAVRAAKAGGVAVGLILLVGAGGEQYYETHVRETVQLIRQMPLTAGDIIYLSPLVSAHGAEYDSLAQLAGIRPLSPDRMAEQERALRAGFDAPGRTSATRPYVAHYEVEHFVF